MFPYKEIATIYFKEGKAYIVNCVDFAIIQSERIHGELTEKGEVVRGPSYPYVCGLPVLLMPEEVHFLIARHRAELVQYVKHPLHTKYDKIYNPLGKKPYATQLRLLQLERERIVKEQCVIADNDRKWKMRVLDRVCDYDFRQQDEMHGNYKYTPLQSHVDIYQLGVTVYEKDFVHVPMDLLDDFSHQRNKIFEDLRMKGNVVINGNRHNADYVLYPRGMEPPHRFSAIVNILTHFEKERVLQINSSKTKQLTFYTSKWAMYKVITNDGKITLQKINLTHC